MTEAIQKQNYDWHQIRRFHEITELLKVLDEQKLALDRELSRNSELLIEYAGRIGSGENTKASDHRFIGALRKIPSESGYPRTVKALARLNDILAAALEGSISQTSKG